ncbi:Hypothetical protein DEACI_3689 [Acididesulfobacillus acetoxydans]|uniref:Uncharacterized protein n=1 Tax=Acididesulfobacillus acetoxydans TaxID=1561005 RepID=A0A8S0XCV7_9FIRM|nr:Hypothetical protein DEACI_3689 [Acididesulfobacillus acetoxydans]CEJ05747.1 Hypothetical protein DEACI_0167 [Acididesulfobacillus acetoxydans]
MTETENTNPNERTTICGTGRVCRNVCATGRYDAARRGPGKAAVMGRSDEGPGELCHDGARWGPRTLENGGSFPERQEGLTTVPSGSVSFAPVLSSD